MSRKFLARLAFFALVFTIASGSAGGYYVWKSWQIQEEIERRELSFTKELESAQSDLAGKQKELEAANTKLKDQQSQLSNTANELKKLRDRPPLFSFRVDSSSISDVEQKKSDIQYLVTQAYDTINSIYGKPYLLHEVVITFTDQLQSTNANAEIVIQNGSNGLDLTIKLRDFNKNDFNDVSAVIHEIIHSFHGLAVLDPVAYEEGITVAATDAVMTSLRSRGVIPNFADLYIRISESTYTSSSLSIPSSYATFYGSNDTQMYYQLTGFGWYALYQADSAFFRKFNEKLYTQKNNGVEITADVVRAIIQEVGPSSVKGRSLSDWLNTAGFKIS
jgi:hypothetical protein